MAIDIDSTRAFIEGNLIDGAAGKALVELVEFSAKPGETDVERGSRFLLSHLGMHFSSACLLPVPSSLGVVISDLDVVGEERRPESRQFGSPPHGLSPRLQTQWLSPWVFASASPSSSSPGYA